MRKIAALFASLAVLAAQPAAAAEPFDAAGWRADLAQMRAAFATRYANLEWAQTVREADLAKAFDDLDRRLGTVTSDAEARALFDGLTGGLKDGHVRISWPSPNAAVAPGVESSPCDDLIVKKTRVSGAVLAPLPGYEPLTTPQSSVFPAGLLTVDGRRIGVVRIAQFSADIAPGYCDEAVAAGIRDDLYDVVYGRMTRDFAAQLRALKAAGAQVLLVDITGNGGGSDWTEALVRMVSDKRLVSTRVDFMRGAHWVAAFDRDIAALETVHATAKGADRALLADLLTQLRARRAEAARPCDGSSWLKGVAPACDILGRGFYSSGLLASADPATLAGKPWAGQVFSPMWYPYEEGVWSGPLIVAVDDRTASAAEQFAVVLQDNRAAVIIGDPTRGAGCGYTGGGTPVTLTHSKGVLRLPDCVRIRASGENEVTGISPDVLAGFHAGDGPKARARRLAEALPAAMARATR